MVDSEAMDYSRFRGAPGGDKRVGGDLQADRVDQGAKPMTLTATIVRVFGWLDDLIDLAMPAIRGMVVLLLGATFWLAADRSPPFKLLSVDHPSPVVAPGGTLFMRASVWRDADRSCSLRAVSRVHFSDGSRMDLPVRDFSAQELKAQEARTPGRVSVAMVVPDWAPTGASYISTTRYYQCNITHRVFPILSENTWAFSVQR